MVCFYHTWWANRLVIRVNDSFIILLKFAIDIVSNCNWLFMKRFNKFIHILVNDTGIRLNFDFGLSCILACLVLSLIRIVWLIVYPLVSNCIHSFVIQSSAATSRSTINQILFWKIIGFISTNFVYGLYCCINCKSPTWSASLLVFNRSHFSEILPIFSSVSKLP